MLYTVKCSLKLQYYSIIIRISEISLYVHIVCGDLGRELKPSGGISGGYGILDPS